jgi:hypothetical protein
MKCTVIQVVPPCSSACLSAKLRMVLASSVVLVSETHGTQDHIFLPDGSGSLHITLYLGDSRRFGGIYLQGPKVNKARNQQKEAKPSSAGSSETSGCLWTTQPSNRKPYCSHYRTLASSSLLRMLSCLLCFQYVFLRYVLFLNESGINGVNEPGMLSRYSDRLQAGRPGFGSWQGKKLLSSPQRPDRLWGPPSLLCSGYRGLFPRAEA